MKHNLTFLPKRKNRVSCTTWTLSWFCRICHVSNIWCVLYLNLMNVKRVFVLPYLLRPILHRCVQWSISRTSISIFMLSIGELIEGWWRGWADGTLRETEASGCCWMSCCYLTWRHLQDWSENFVICSIVFWSIYSDGRYRVEYDLIHLGYRTLMEYFDITGSNYACKGSGTLRQI
jgi:hypothetical protein